MINTESNSKEWLRAMLDVVVAFLRVVQQEKEKNMATEMEGGKETGKAGFREKFPFWDHIRRFFAIKNLLAVFPFQSPS